MSPDLPRNLLEKMVRRFVLDASLGKSGYWLGVKLSGVLTEIRDYYRSLYYYDKEEYEKQVQLAFQAFLNHNEVLRILAVKYNLKGEILQLAGYDPRFRDLRPYKDLIAEAFEHAATLHPTQIQQPSVSRDKKAPSPIAQGNLDWDDRFSSQHYYTFALKETSRDEPTYPTIGERHTSTQRIVKIREDWKGTYGGTYYYVKEGNMLRRISDYAISQRKVYESKRGPTIEYDIPAERLHDKIIYMFSFTNKGYLFIRKFTLEALLNPKDPRYPYIPNYDMIQNVSLDELTKLTFEIKDRVLYSLLEDLRRYYIPMINDLNDYSERMGFRILFMGHAERTHSLLKDPYVGIVECMAPPNDRDRFRCLEKPMAWIYQLWVMKLISEALGVEEVVKGPYEDRPSWWIEQGKPYPSFIARSRMEYYTFWFEFQPHEMAHLAGMFSRERVHVRPDIVVSRGFYSSFEELVEHGKRIDLIVECKNTDFKYWEKDIYSQIPAYISTFRPRTLLLVSLKRIPTDAKHSLSSRNVIVFDGLSPGNDSRIEEFKKLVRQLL